MNIDKLRAMLDLKAVQNFSTNNTSANETSMFQDILNEILTDDERAEFSKPLNSSPVSTVSPIAMTSLPPLSLLNTTSDMDQLINQASQQCDLPAKLIKAVIQHESNFNPNALSKAGASGLMQLMPATARSLGVNDVFDPEQNILAGSKYLKQMLDRYDGNLELSLAAYNAGPANVDKYGRIPPFKETANYVQKITDSYYS
ncbi:lytic transglycosylase domain-containing protein [Bacillus sp. EB600]|uniref:lytic transglycosylase domain-containing protein n=1 Tax=Bacillus sp. EB600 TaxID=2806345 RepID=UPI00210A22C9|nr:lytic transglycosylase domain-containing protein [Bacillus sp. EB600]MCQ6280956.1 lytic transglycosylase domain-containing protein [Bacillus sp. EB600]